MEIIHLGTAEHMHIGKTYGEELKKGEVEAINGWEVFTDNRHMDTIEEFTTNLQYAETLKGQIAEVIEIINAHTSELIERVTINKIRKKTKTQLGIERKKYLVASIQTHLNIALTELEELKK